MSYIYEYDVYFTRKKYGINVVIFRADENFVHVAYLHEA